MWDCTDFFGDLMSKVKVTSEVKVTQKIKSAGNLMKRVENKKSHFQFSHKKKEKCGKLAKMCGELKISFSKFLYKIDIFGGLSHFVVAQHWFRGAMFICASRYLLSQMRKLTRWSLFI